MSLLHCCCHTENLSIKIKIEFETLIRSSTHTVVVVDVVIIIIVENQALQGHRIYINKNGFGCMFAVLASPFFSNLCSFSVACVCAVYSRYACAEFINSRYARVSRLHRNGRSIFGARNGKKDLNWIWYCVSVWVCISTAISCTMRVCELRNNQIFFFCFFSGTKFNEITLWQAEANSDENLYIY